MAGTLLGGQRAADTNRERYGIDYYSRIAKLGKGVKRPGAGFASNRELARKMGAVGGRISKRTKKHEKDSSKSQETPKEA